MKKPSNKQEHRLFTQRISKNEHQLDNLRHDNRKINHVLSDLEADLQQGFQKISQLTEEQLKFEKSNNLHLLHKNEQQARFFQEQLLNASEQINNAHNEEAKKIKDDREKLYKQRSDIPWD